jgi:hypothetical protein
MIGLGMDVGGRRGRIRGVAGVTSGGLCHSDIRRRTFGHGDGMKREENSPLA